MPRPLRLKVRDARGGLRSLPGAELAYAPWPGGDPSRLVLFGLGAEPLALAARIPHEVRVGYWVAPELWEQLPDEARRKIPAAWTRLDADAACGWVGLGACVWEEPFGLKLFPETTAPVKARLLRAAAEARARAAGGDADAPAKDQPGRGDARTPAQGQPGERGPLAPGRAGTMLVAQGSRTLIGRELAAAASELGFTVLSHAPAHIEAHLADILAGQAVDVFVSINFEGLDPLGVNAELCRAYGVRLGVWLVDNPLHLLSGVSSAYWKDCPLLLSDESFAPLLRGLGARAVWPLALGAASHFFTGPVPAGCERFPGVVFVGRSEFPGRESFFAGLSLPGDLWDEAVALLDAGGRPDFAWWLDRLSPAPLWPGRAVRLAGLGAVAANRLYRARILEALGRRFPLRVHGDAAFKELVDAPFEMAGPVDYYGRLSAVYAGAGVNLALGSLLLPWGLTQRHFDVPAAGGRLVSDATPGLAVFGQDASLVPAFRTKDELCELVEAALSGPSDQRPLSEVVRLRHQYVHRLRGLLEHL